MAASTGIPSPPSGRIVRVSLPGDRALEQLTAALTDRDPDAFVAIQERYGSTLLGYLTGMLGDRAAAEDVLQVTLLEAWQRAATYDRSRGSLLTWLLTIARSRAIDHLRRRVPEPHDPTAASGPLQRDGHVDARADQLLEQWRVAGLLRQLPREEAILLRMRFYDGLSQREISGRTGIALGTVKMRMVQALDRLRGLLDAEETVP